MQAIARAALGFGFLIAGLGPAAAADDQNAGSGDNGIQGYIAAGAGLIPDYIGSKYYEATPYVEARANYGNYYLRFEGGSLHLNIVDNSNFHAGPLIGVRLDRGDVGSDAVSRMRHLDFGVTEGGFVEYEHVAQDPRSGERVVLDVASGDINQEGGVTATLRGTIRRPVEFVDPGLIATLEGDVTWGNRTYMQTYFGVDAPDSAASGLPFYAARSGFSSIGAAVALDQFLSRKWSIGVRFHYARLLGSSAQSPVTAIVGSPNQFFTGVVLGYVL